AAGTLAGAAGAESAGAGCTSKKGARLDKSSVAGFDGGSDGAKSDAGLSDGRASSKLRTGGWLGAGPSVFGTDSRGATLGGSAGTREADSRFFSQGSTSGSSEPNEGARGTAGIPESGLGLGGADRKSTRLNSSHVAISYAVFCLKKKS